MTEILPGVILPLFMSAETVELQAPPGTYQRLTSLENARLGNAATKRFVSVLQMPNTWADLRGNPNLTLNMAVVNLRILNKRGSNTEENYYFGIKPGDSVVLLAAWQYEDGVGRTERELPSLDFLLREISVAERLQPKLKRR